MKLSSFSMLLAHVQRAQRGLVGEFGGLVLVGHAVVMPRAAMA